MRITSTLRAVSLVVVTLVPALASAQALTSLTSVRVTYVTRKNTVKPDGELKRQIDALDAAIADATRAGQTGELRRLFAKGMTLLAGRPWTPEADFAASLALRTERVVADSAMPYAVRLEQIYAPSIDLAHPLDARAALRAVPTVPPAPGATPEPPPVVKDFGVVQGLGRDLRESPFPFTLDLSEVRDGRYVLAVTVLNGGSPLGTAMLAVSLRKGLDDRLKRLESETARAPEAARADILYPVDYIRNVNRGRIPLGAFDVEKELALADDALAAALAGRPPFAGKTGDFKRHYALATAGEIMPYRMYVPTTYNGSRAAPLVVALHGLGGTEDSLFGANYGNVLAKLAEQHGFIVAAPLGYRVDGGYGYGLGDPPGDIVTRHRTELSEEDVMQVLQHVRQQYTIDENRIYLMGHSMGAIGTWKLAAKYPDIWAAIGPISGSGTPATLARFARIPEIVVHGDADPTVNVSGSRTMVEEMHRLKIEVRYIEVPGAGHTNVAGPNFPAVFDFFDAHKKSARVSQ